MLEVGTGLLPWRTGKLFLTLSCNLIFFSIRWREGLGFCSYSHFIAFWVMANCSQLGTNQGFPKQTKEGASTRTCHLLQCMLCFPLALHLEIPGVFRLHKLCLREAQKGELMHKKLKPLQMQGSVSMQWRRQPHSTVWNGVVIRGFYQKEGKVPIKASGKFYGVWDC